MRLSLHPCEGTGRQWRITLEISGVKLFADVGKRTFDEKPEWSHGRLIQDERVMSLAQSRTIAYALGLLSEVDHDDSHWTWTP